MRGSLLLFYSCLVFGQTSPGTPPKGLLGGTVLNSATGGPVRKAQVTLTDTSGAEMGTATNDEGRFAFTALAPGGYVLTASREGFDPAPVHGLSRLLHVTLASGEQKDDVAIRLTPLGVISGRTLDQDGDPIRQIRVQALVYRYVESGRKLIPCGHAVSNDLDEYRIYNLPPGRYHLEAASDEERPSGPTYGTSYYPGSPDPAGATPIEVGEGQQVPGIDLTLHPTRPAGIRGRVVNHGKDLMVELEDVMEGTVTEVGVDGRDGKFEIQAVLPGSYILTARSTFGGRHYAAHLPIQVGADDLEGIEMRLLPPMEIAGQIRIEGHSSVKLSRLDIDFESQTTAYKASPSDDGSFLIEGVEPDVYWVSVTNVRLEDLYLKAVRWSDRDVTQPGLDLTQGASESRLVVVMSANGGQIDGVVEDDRSAPAVNATVFLVPSGVAPSKSLFKLGMTGAGGHFRIGGIAPGSYRLFAWADVDPCEVMNDPDLLLPFNSQGKDIEISEGIKESVQLKPVER